MAERGMGRAVLIVEDEATLARNMSVYLTRRGFDARWASEGGQALREIESFKPDVILLDLNMDGMGGLEALGRIREVDAQTPVIVVTAQADVRTAVEAMRAGATDYLQKPVPLDQLELEIGKVLRDARRGGELAYHRGRQASGSGVDMILGGSRAIEEVRARLRHFLDAEGRLSDGPPPNVLVTGETGVGKQLVARAFHFDGARRSKPFVEINCAALPSHLVEAELFGFEKGAFTDAKERKIGLIEAADGGTLFLDEVGELDLKTQAKLLKALEDRAVRRLGGVRDVKVDVRIVAATNRALAARVRDGEFRSDLYFRLRVIHVELPPLRERDGDVELLAEEFLRVHARRYGRRDMAFSPAALAALRRHAWPGNVRELSHAIESAILLAPGPAVDACHLALQGVQDAGSPGEGDVAALVLDRGVSLEELDAKLVDEAMRRAGGNATQAARLLGISRDAMRYRLEKRRIAG